MLEPQSDKQYLDWIKEHPEGFVINAHKSGSVPMYWHRANCGHLHWDNTEVNWVQGEYLKACSLDPGELAVWAKAQPEQLHYCKHCHAAWEKGK